MNELLQQVLGRPLYQAVFFCVVMVLLFVVVRPADKEALWMMAGITYVLFMLVNAVMVWHTDSQWTYFFISLLVSVSYLIVANSAVKAHTVLFKTEGSDESSMVFLVIMYHPVAVLVVMLVKWAVGRFF